MDQVTTTKNNMQNRRKPFTSNMHDSALSFIANKKCEHQMWNITKINIPTQGWTFTSASWLISLQKHTS